MLRLTPTHFHAMRTHAEHIYPEECCGLLLGQSVRVGDAITSEGDRHLVELWQTENTWSHDVEESPGVDLSKHRRYWIDPKEILAAQRYARDRQLDIIGVYHSHPDHPAVPSECDRALAWGNYSYIIISVHQGNTQDLLCWCLDETSQFQPESLMICDPSHEPSRILDFGF